MGVIAGRLMETSSNRQRNLLTIEALAIKPGERFFELGCGPGLAVEAALAKGARSVLALDHSREMLRQARGRLRAAIKEGRVELRLGNLNATRPEDGPFDAAALVNVAQHLPDCVLSFSIIAGLLRVGGRIAVIYQPSSRATATAAREGEYFAGKFTSALTAAGYRQVGRQTLAAPPFPAVCILAVK
jgi:protein-L-isoaspartate O-methyltransferase